jgi:hypothetical protein
MDYILHPLNQSDIVYKIHSNFASSSVLVGQIVYGLNY